MKNRTIAMLTDEYRRYPFLTAASPPTPKEINDAQETLDVIFHDDYIEFLLTFGGGMVGSLPVYGLRPVEVFGKSWSVVDVTLRFRRDNWPHTNDSYVISTDGRGNPIGVAPDARLMSYDHDVGDYYEVAEHLEAFIIAQLLS